METKTANKEQLQSCTLPNSKKVYFEESKGSYFEVLLQDIRKLALCLILRAMAQKIYKIVNSAIDSHTELRRMLVGFNQH